MLCKIIWGLKVWGDGKIIFNLGVFLLYCFVCDIYNIKYCIIICNLFIYLLF